MYITIAACGFQHEVWQKQYFPEDLPKEWYFDYYSNEHDAILFSDIEQVSLGVDALSEMLSDVDDGFLFVFEGSENLKSLMLDAGLVNARLIFVSFPPELTSGRFLKIPFLNNSKVTLEQAIIIEQVNVSKTVCVLRVNSALPINNEDIKYVLMHIHSNFGGYDQVCLFFGQRLQDIEVINTAKIINDLL